MKTIRRSLLPAILTAAFAPSAFAGAPDTEAVEFYNRHLDHYFVTATASEAFAIDGGMAGEGWVRTGRSFQAWSTKEAAPPDAMPVCRFYSSAASSHFYTASAGECAHLRAQEALERNAGRGVRGWMYEGVAFYIQAPKGGACPAGTAKLDRAYNDGFATGAGANHRFVDDGGLMELMADRAWVVEGTVMCAPAKRGGGNANLPPTTTDFSALAGTWEGNARWKLESSAGETRTVAPLSLAIDEEGAVTGSGGGCTFEGRLTRGDGFRAHYRGELSATGCTVEGFGGAGQKLRIERFGDGSIVAHIQHEEEGLESKIEALLVNAQEPPPQEALPYAAVEGAWIGTVGWKAEASTAGESEETSVNQALELAVSGTGTLTGSGYGCTLTGTLSAPIRDTGPAWRVRYEGAVEAAGCTDPIFNGTYRARVDALDGSLRIDFKREESGEDGTVEVKVKGTLESADE